MAFHSCVREVLNSLVEENKLLLMLPRVNKFRVRCVSCEETSRAKDKDNEAKRNDVGGVE
jgi:hypothetical protein